MRHGCRLFSSEFSSHRLLQVTQSTEAHAGAQRLHCLRLVPQISPKEPLIVETFYNLSLSRLYCISLRCIASPFIWGELYTEPLLRNTQKRELKDRISAKGIYEITILKSQLSSIKHQKAPKNGCYLIYITVGAIIG